MILYCLLYCLFSTNLAQILSVDFPASNHAAWSVALNNDEIYAGFGDGSIKSYPRNIKFAGHTGTVNKLLASDTLFSGSKDSTIKQWNYDGSLIRNYTGHTQEVVSLALSGTTLYSASEDGLIFAWRTTDGTYLSNFTGHSDGVWDVAIDGDNLFSASADKTAKQWSVSNGSLIHTFVGHTNYVNAVAVYGTSLFTASYDATILQWDIPSGKLITNLTGHSDTILCLAITSTSLLSGSDDATVIEWDLNNNMAKIRKYQVHTAGVTSISVTKDPQVVVSASSDGSVKQWALTGMTPHIGDGNATDPSTVPSISMSPSNSLSIGVIIGIVIGCLVFLALCIVGVWVWRRRSKSVPFNASQSSNGSQSSDPVEPRMAPVSHNALFVPADVPYDNLSVPSPTFSQSHPNPTELYLRNHASDQHYSVRRTDHGQDRPCSMQEFEDGPYTPSSPYSVQERDYSRGRPYSMQGMEYVRGRHVEPGTLQTKYHPPSYDQAFLASLDFNHDN